MLIFSVEVNLKLLKFRQNVVKIAEFWTTIEKVSDILNIPLQTMRYVLSNLVRNVEFGAVHFEPRFFSPKDA